jgi:hypothetical protein
MNISDNGEFAVCNCSCSDTPTTLPRPLLTRTLERRWGACQAASPHPPPLDPLAAAVAGPRRGGGGPSRQMEVWGWSLDTAVGICRGGDGQLVDVSG